jgi:hypothetical protein
MAFAALIAWLITAGGGLYLLAVWLIEYDRDFQASKATRLPIPVIGTHALLAVAGIVVWSAYLLLDEDALAWTAVAILVCVAALGLTMAVRWFRAGRAAQARSGRGVRSALARESTLAREAVPPERNFPVPVVIGHGIFAMATIILVLLTALGIHPG